MLEELMETWNNNPLRTEKNSSPLQLCKSPELMNSANVNIDEFYGVDYDGLVGNIEIKIMLRYQKLNLTFLMSNMNIYE